MPALHVIGEIVGASGLRPREALSVAHWLDALSLHPSSKRGFFCRWRLHVRAFDGGGNGISPWCVLQGASRGQTQVHAWSPVTLLEGETITTSSQGNRGSRRRQEDPAQQDEEHEATDPPVELETLWSHPIDLHLAMSEAPPLPASWPFLEFQVWSLDEFHRERLVGSASTPLPAAQHEFLMDLPLTSISRASSSLRETAAEFLDLKHADALTHWGDETLADSAEEEVGEEVDGQLTIATSVGTLYVRLAVVPQGLLARGVLA